VISSIKKEKIEILQINREINDEIILLKNKSKEDQEALNK